VRHGLDVVDLENPEVCLPTVRLEERIMIGAEMPGCVLSMGTQRFAVTTAKCSKLISRFCIRESA
jgi:hypothetical protein